MKHRERVMAALEHHETDRCPMQISFTPEFAERLHVDPRLRDRPGGLQTASASPHGGLREGHNPHGGGNTYELERALGEDMLQTSVGWANCYYQAGDEYTDEWGIGWRSCPTRRPSAPGTTPRWCGHPLADDGAISQYHAPDPDRPGALRRRPRTLGAASKDEYWIVGVTVCTIWETAWALRGYDRLLTDLVTDPDLAERILDIPYHYHLTAAKRLVEMGVDMIWIGDDVGSQRAMLMSPSMWRRFLKPRMANFIADAARPSTRRSRSPITPTARSGRSSPT